MADHGMATDIAAQAVTAAVPLVLAGCGELVAERSGTLNIGIEGLMLAGCCAGFAAVACGAPPWLGLTAAVAAGMALAGLFALATVWGRADGIVAGMAINLIAAGGSGAAYQLLQSHQRDQLAPGQGFARSGLPGLGHALDGVPLLGPVLGDQYLLAYVAMALVGALAWALRRTRAGLIVRALGDAPDACAAAGVRVRVWRGGCLLFAGACAGAAGAYLSIMRTHSFVPLMTGGQGFVVLALVIFGRWRLSGLVLGCLAFGALDSLQQHLQGLGLNAVVPYQLFKALPFVVALAALAIMARSAAGPRELGRSWG